MQRGSRLPQQMGQAKMAQVRSRTVERVPMAQVRSRTVELVPMGLKVQVRSRTVDQQSERTGFQKPLSRKPL